MWWDRSKDNSRAHFNLWNFGAKYFQFKNELFTYYELQGRSVLNRSLMFADVCSFVRILWREISISYHFAIPMRLYGVCLTRLYFFRSCKNGRNRYVIRYESAYWRLHKIHVINTTMNGSVDPWPSLRWYRIIPHIVWFHKSVGCLQFQLISTVYESSFVTGPSQRMTPSHHKIPLTVLQISIQLILLTSLCC